MDHSSITQPNQSISIIIDQHMNDQQQQQVYETSSMQNAKIIKIQHSIEQPQYLTLNNRKNNKTLIDIKRNNDYEQDDLQKNDHVLQINCSTATTTSNNEFTSREIKEILENIENDTSKLEYNGSLRERGKNEQQINLAKEESLIKDSNTQMKRVLELEKDVKEESGQTASQQQKQQQQQVNNNVNENGNSKHRENGQNSTKTMIFNETTKQLNKLSNHNEEELKYFNEDQQDHNEKQVNNDHVHNDDDLETPVHNKVTSNREDEEDNDNDSNSNSSGISSISGGISLIQREVIGDFSHGKRSLYEENSNSLLTKADATTSTTLLTINANQSQQQLINSKVLNNFENLTNLKKNQNNNNHELN